jgi:hypothetical protein
MKLKLKDSIYQQKGAGYGLSMSGGMQINNRPDGMTGIAQAAMIKKQIRHSEKVNVIAEGVSLGEMRSNMLEENY